MALLLTLIFLGALPFGRVFATPTLFVTRDPINDAEQYLEAHNNFRVLHDAEPLVWDDELARKAQIWANRCVFEHSHGRLGDPQTGENIAAGAGTEVNYDYNIPDCVKTWTDESVEYHPEKPEASHFTQVVWKSTTHVGCASAECQGMLGGPGYGPSRYHVCEYYPPGNWRGQFPYVMDSRNLSEAKTNLKRL